MPSSFNRCSALVSRELSRVPICSCEFVFMLFSPTKGEVKGSVWSLLPYPRPSKQHGPPTAASNTSISIAGVPGEVSHQQVACFFPVASYGCNLTRSVSSNCWAYPTCHWREGGRPQLSQKGQSNVCCKTAEWIPLGHSHDGRLRFATTSLGRNVANLER